MKKRRSRTRIVPRSPKSSPKSGRSNAFDSFPNRTKSSQDLKRRRLQRGNSKFQCTDRSQNHDTFVKRDLFGSLESLFDVKKPFNLPEINFLSFDSGLKYHANSSPERKITRVPSDKVQTLFVQQSNYESNLLKEVYDSHIDSSPENKSESKSNEVDSEDLKLNIEDFKEDQSSEENISLNTMADEPDNEEVENEPEEVEEAAPGEEGEEEPPGDSISIPADDVQALPPEYPMPTGVGEGAPIKPGGRNDSILSASPLGDETVMREMKYADERCLIIAEEIDEMRREVTELTNKKNLTEEDTLVIQEKQDNIMAKLSEFEEMTRKIQRLLGLTDPSSETFAKLFDLLPSGRKILGKDGERKKGVYSKESLDEEEELEGEEDMDRGEGIRKPFTKKKKGYKTMEIADERFDMPQVSYPEDKLPRVIVCGYTEEKIPKIIVADTERKGKKCLENLTGKLTESLSMQEKLAKENAQLEGGKYKLEEALLEKDSAVESLQRKVCGLQAEMRIVVKENTELSRQLAFINQRVTSPTCCSTCPGGTPSSPPTCSSLRPYSYSSSLPKDCGYCQCNCCLQSQFPDVLPLPDDAVCVTPKNNGNTSPVCSPRLAGGASETGCCYPSIPTSSRADEMCCRSPAVSKPPCPGPCPGPPRGTCPVELENKLTIYGNSTKQLEHQLGNMETEVRNLQMELANVQRERQQLEQQRKLLKCTGPCAPCSCCPPPPSTMPCSSAMFMQAPTMPQAPAPAPSMTLAKMSQQTAPATCTGPCITAPMGTSTCPQQQLRDLREQYARLQDDYKSKLCEVSNLRVDTEKLKEECRDTREEKEKMEIKMIDATERLKILETEKEKFEGRKEQLVEQEQALAVAKQRFREAQDELEELRSLIQDQAGQLEDYRNKYLQAQQYVEEQRRQLDLMEMDNARMNENVTLEIGRVKGQFQEKLAELAPLPDILKQTQMKLQESQQMRIVAERSCEDLSRELLGYKEKIQTLQNQLDTLRNEYQTLQEESGHGSGKFDELQRKNNELRHETERMKNTLSRFEEHEAQLQKRIDEKMHEITQLTAMLEQVREDSARQVARTKERCETVRRTMQSQVADMERQLAQCRATARSAQKDRDEIRQKMQGQINNLNEAVEQAQGRIRSLQGHVNYLKTSYSNIFKGPGESGGDVLHGDGAGGGYDSCDCNY